MGDEILGKCHPNRVPLSGKFAVAVIQLLAFAINSYKIDLNIRAVGLENTCETCLGLAD